MNISNHEILEDEDGGDEPLVSWCTYAQAGMVIIVATVIFSSVALWKIVSTLTS